MYCSLPRIQDNDFRSATEPVSWLLPAVLTVCITSTNRAITEKGAFLCSHLYLPSNHLLLTPPPDLAVVEPPLKPLSELSRRFVLPPGVTDPAQMEELEQQWANQLRSVRVITRSAPLFKEVAFDWLPCHLLALNKSSSSVVPDRINACEMGCSLLVSLLKKLNITPPPQKDALLHFDNRSQRRFAKVKSARPFFST